jgi:hypothetical protein
MRKRTPAEWAKGYVRVARSTMLHRLVAEVKIGRPLAADETVDHTCHNRDPLCPGGNACLHRRCVNAAHLEVVDAVENWRRGQHGGLSKGQVVGKAALNLAKTHCPNDHPYAEKNLRANKTGARGGKACHRARAAGRDPRLEPTYI